jgi:hypothetical protein
MSTKCLSTALQGRSFDALNAVHGHLDETSGSTEGAERVDKLCRGLFPSQDAAANQMSQQTAKNADARACLRAGGEGGVG